MKTFFTCLIVLLLLSTGAALAQNRQISGKVTTLTGQPLPTVTVLVKGTAIGTYTQKDGSFKLSIPINSKLIVFRMVGYKTQEIEIGTKDVFNIQLPEDAMMTEQVVVTAIGLEKEKKSIGYSIEEVKGQTLTNAHAVDMIGDLNGKVAGLNITSSSGTPGAASFINLRGMSSITGENQPLFVIDGVPIDNSMDYSGNPDNLSNNLLSGVNYSNRAVDINPDDISSVSVLKGPAATALYGIRAAGGAIIITTKKGVSMTDQKINVSYTSSLSFDVVNKLPGLQDKFSQGISGQYLYPNDTTPNAKYRSLSWGAAIDTLMWTGLNDNPFDKHGYIVGKSNPNGKIPVTAYNNPSTFFTTGATWDESVSMAGGTELGTFYLSLSNSNSTGIVPNSTFDRTTARLNGSAKISEKFKASADLSYTNSGGLRTQQGSNTSGVMLGLLRTPPTFDNSNGFGHDAALQPSAYEFLETGKQRTYRGGGGYDNPFWTVNMNPFRDNVDRFMGDIQLNYFVTDWFDILYRVGADVYTDKRKQFYAIYSAAFPAGQIFYHDITNKDMNSDLLFNFNYKFADHITTKLTLGNNLYSSDYHYVYTQGDGMVIPNFYHISNTTGQIVREVDQRLRRAALFADATADYDSWIYLNGTLRNEWSTTLPQGNNSFLFGSINMSFIFTEALPDIFKNTPISYGKLRANYAIVGKDAPLYSVLTQFTQSTFADGFTNGISFPFNGIVGYTNGITLGNPNLTPEKTSSYEVGLSATFFDNLFSIDLTYYYSDGKDQIFPVPVASSSGYFREVLNAGEITNKGIEAVITATPLKIGDFKWDLAFNYAANKNMVVKLAEGVDNIFIGGFLGSDVRAVAGQPYGSIYGFGWLRDKSGNVIIDGDPTSQNYGFPILDQTEKSFGTSAPLYKIGFTNTFSWKGLTLSFLIDIKEGGVMWNGTKGALYYFGTAKETEIRGTSKVFSGVKQLPDGTLQKNDISVVIDENWLAFGNGNGFYGSNTEDFIEKTSWFRLRELSLSYQFPSSILELTPFSDAVITFTGRNLFLSTPYTGVDPETNLMGSFNAQGLDYFNMPGTRTYNIAINVKF